jgi:hypothetical protein
VIPYWVLFALPAIAMMMSADRPERRHLLPLVLFGVVAVVMIGTRYEVGADWPAYTRYVARLRFIPFTDAVLTTDAAYATLNWCMVKVGLGMTGVNLVCGMIFIWGLIDFAWDMPNPWLAVVVAVPYLLIVVAMGYTRQGVALGFEFLALRRLAAGQHKLFYAFVLAAAAFHKTAVVLSLFGIFAGPTPFTFARGLVGSLVAALSFFAFLEDHYETLVKNYIEARLDSAGGMIRVLMNALPGAVLLLWYRKWARRLRVDGPWLLFAAASLVCVATVQIATTAVDRAALYLAPLQLYVWSSLPNLTSSVLLKPAIVGYHGVVLFVWLQFADHSRFWLPYQSTLLP